MSRICTSVRKRLVSLPQSKQRHRHTCHHDERKRVSEREREKETERKKEREKERERESERARKRESCNVVVVITGIRA
jgi:hypothetical protein